MNSFEEIYDSYSKMIFRTAFLMTGDYYDAEDVCQETFVIAFTRLYQLRERSSIKAWLFSIMTNEVRRKKRKDMREISDGDITDRIDKDPHQDKIGPAQELLPDQIDLMNDLDRLSQKQREAIVMYYYNGLSIKEIARITGSFEGTVKSRLSAGRRALKEILIKDEKETEAIKLC